MVKKKFLSVALVAATVCSMIFTGCGSSADNTGNDTGKTDTAAQAGNTAGDVADDVEKPEKITIMVDGTFQATLADGQEEWVNKWEELTGIELEVIQAESRIILSRKRLGNKRTSFKSKLSTCIGAVVTFFIFPACCPG